MAKSRDTLIYIDAPGRRYFAKQNFRAEISQAEVCKVKTHNINNLRIYAYHLCNRTARGNTAKGRVLHRQKPSTRHETTAFAPAKGRQPHCKRQSFTRRKGANSTAEGRKRRYGRPFPAPPFSISRKTDDILMLTHCHRFAPLSLLFETTLKRYLPKSRQSVTVMPHPDAASSRQN